MAMNVDCPKCGHDSCEDPPIKMYISVDPPGFACVCQVCGYEWIYHIFGECL